MSSAQLNILVPFYRGIDFSPAPDRVVELSPRALSFLSNLFDLHDLNQEGVISSSQLQQLFTTCPEAACDSEVWRQLQVRLFIAFGCSTTSCLLMRHVPRDSVLALASMVFVASA